MHASKVDLLSFRKSDSSWFTLSKVTSVRVSRFSRSWTKLKIHKYYHHTVILQPPYHAIEKNRPGRVPKNQRDSNKSPRFLDSQPSEWTNIIPQIPQTSNNKSPYDYQMIGNSFSYTGNFVFFGLTPSTEYEVIIQSRNREGWSDATDIFRFNTRSQGK